MGLKRDNVRCMVAAIKKKGLIPVNKKYCVCVWRRKGITSEMTCLC